MDCAKRPCSSSIATERNRAFCKATPAQGMVGRWTRQNAERARWARSSTRAAIDQNLNTRFVVSRVSVFLVPGVTSELWRTW